MKLSITNAVALVAVSGLLAVGNTAMATNGYFTHGVGTESKGMAGSGVGSDAAQGPIIGASNPALAVFAGDSWEIGLAAFSPMRSYTASDSLAMGSGGAFTIGPGKFDSSSEWFPIPYVAKNFRLGNDSVINLVFYGRGGMNTDWDDSNASAWYDPTGAGGMGMQYPGTFGAGDAGVDLSQAFLAVNWAGRAGDNFAWGIGPVVAFQMFEATGLASFTPYTKTFNVAYGGCLQGGGDPATCQGQAALEVTSLTNNSHDTSTGYGFAGGIWWGLGDAVSIGLAYQSKMSMSDLDDYSDLYAEAGGFDIPASTKFGISFKGMNNVRINLDIEHTEFSDVTSVGNPMANLFACPSAGAGGMDIEGCLGGDNGAGFGWDDMTTYKLGVEWTHNDTATWRFGYSYGEQPIPESEVLFNILAPGVMEQHITFGLTQQTSNGNAWNLSLMYAPSKSIEGVSPFDPTQTIELEMSQFELEVSFLF